MEVGNDFKCRFFSSRSTLYPLALHAWMMMEHCRAHACVLLSRFITVACPLAVCFGARVLHKQLLQPLHARSTSDEERIACAPHASCKVKEDNRMFVVASKQERSCTVLTDACNHTR